MKVWFYPGRSTVGAVKAIVDSILLPFENKNLVCSGLVHLSQAFDIISHNIITEKLK